jgi:site-specific DNA recombinase
MSRLKEAASNGAGANKYAAIYARVSTEDQGKGFSIPTQIEACQKLADREGYSVSEGYVLVDEGISGTTMDRPGLKQLRDFVKARVISAIFVYDPDRLSRNLGHQLVLAEEMDKAGVNLRIISHPLEQGPEGWLFFQMRGALAEYERAKILERTKRGMLGRAKAGHPNGGQVPLGYRYVAAAHGGCWEIDLEEAQIVQRIFFMCLSGMAVRTIACQLTVERVKTRLDRRPKSGGVKSHQEGVWVWGSVHQILRNEAYAGKAYFGRRQRLSNGRRQLRSSEEWICIPVPAIVDQQTFDTAQAQLRKNQVTARRNRKHEYLLAGGFFRCAQCGRMMTGRVTPKGKRRYRCTSRVNVLDIQKRCRGSILADDVESRVWNAVETLLKNPGLIAAEVRRQHEQSDEIKAEIGRHLDAVESALLKCVREDERWTKAYAAEVIDLDELKQHRAALVTRRKSLKDQHAQLEAELNRVQSNMHHVDQLIEYCARVRKRLQTFSFEEKRLALEALDIQATWAADQALSVRGSIPMGEVPSIRTDDVIMFIPPCRAVRPPRWLGAPAAGGEDRQQPGRILDGEPRWPGL